MDSLDPFERPPDRIRNVYKKYQKMKVQDLEKDIDIADIDSDTSLFRKGNIKTSKIILEDDLVAAFSTYTGSARLESPVSPVPVYEHRDMPGLQIIPNLLPPEIQTLLLSRLLHRDLSNPTHLTNIHTHYKLQYPPDSSSFFSFPPTHQAYIATPLDPAIHKPLTPAQLLNKKLRWTTLGGQYDWTHKRYPDTPPPPFPPDTKALLESLFTDTKAEAAIVNLYSPGDTLSVHRDVAEHCATGLVSISLGCDAIFVIGRVDEQTGEEKVVAMRLRSGSAVYMSGESRFAWHGVPQILAGTCPEYLAEWPRGEGEGGFEEWRGWMRAKRVNLNVRQMFNV